MSDRDHEKADVTLAFTAWQRTVWGYDEFYASTAPAFSAFGHE
jgi:hypothetical protein